MKKITTLILIAVLVGTMAVMPVSAQTIISTPVEMQPIKISPIAYTSDFDAYSNVVGVLNSDGTKTAYIFASPADAAQVDVITGLISPVGQPSAELNAGASQNLVPVEDATGFICETSNEYSKNFTVEYTYMTSSDYEQNEQLVFHLQSDLQGNVYIKDFAAHHYGEESQEG